MDLYFSKEVCEGKGKLMQNSVDCFPAGEMSDRRMNAGPLSAKIPAFRQFKFRVLKSSLSATLLKLSTL